MSLVSRLSPLHLPLAVIATLGAALLLAVGIGETLRPAAAMRTVLPPPAQAVHVAAFPKLTAKPPAEQPIFDAEEQMPLTARLARWDRLVSEAAKRFDVPSEWIVAVMRQESGGRTVLEGDIPITSITGAMGLMQVMPDTYAEMRAQYNLGKDPYNARDNLLAGTAYLKWLHGKYGYPAMFAAYNDGPGNIELNMAGKHPLPAETIAYLTNIRTRLGDPPSAGEAGLGNNGKATLTRPDGQSVTIAGIDVKSVRAVLPGEYPESAAAVIDMGKIRQAVREDVSAATQLLRRAGAKF